MVRKLEQLPEALEPRYHSSSPNTTIGLFEGELELHLASGQILAATGTVEWRWLPSPVIRFAVSALHHYPDPSNLSEAVLHIPTLSLSCEASVTNMELADTVAHYSGLLHTPVLVGVNPHCERVVFHLPNLRWYMGEAIRDKDLRTWRGRWCLDTDRWVITLDAARTVRELIGALRDQGGFAFTHTGQLRRADGGHFTVDEADDVLDAVHFFLSFARGFWCGPVLALGQMNDADSWQAWAPPDLTPWRAVGSWFPSLDARNNMTKLNQAFRGYWGKWEDGLWKDPMKQSIHWYVESNIGAGGIEGAIVLTQAALELLSWSYLVEDPATAAFKVASFNKVSAAEKISRLLEALGIPLGIPASLKNLRSEVAALHASNGPEVFVTLRNAIVHPKKSKRSVVLRTPVLARVEARELGLWYLELALLRIFGYEGDYYQRFVTGWPDEVRSRVPWA